MNSKKSKTLQFYLSNIKPYSDRVPYFRALTRSIWTIIWKSKLKLKSLWLSINFEKIHWISPRKINYALERNEFPILEYRYKGKKSNRYGGLTGNIIKFEKKVIYQSFYHHFIGGKKWEETDFYRRVINEIKDGKYKWGCSSASEYNRRCKELDKLYYDIKSNGIKIQKTLSGTALLKENRIKEIKDEIGILIGPEGELIHCNGQHRLAMAKILNLDSVPVQIFNRDKKWIEFRKEILTYIRREMKGKAYQPLLHPDLSDIPSVWSDKRFEIIRRALTIKNGTLLDIGAHWGYFCHKFEEIGFQCTAMEGSPKNLYFLRKLRRAGNASFKIVNKSVFDCEDDKNELNFDVILALNIFNQFRDIEKKDLYFKLVKLFRILKAKEIYFQMPDEPKGIQQVQEQVEVQVKDKYRNINRNRNRGKNYSYQEIIDFIIGNTNFNNVDRIGEERNCSIYKLY